MLTRDSGLMQYNLHIGVVMNIPLCCQADRPSHFQLDLRRVQMGKSLPVGLQIIGKAFGEAEIIRIAHVFEQTADFASGRPPAFS